MSEIAKRIASLDQRVSALEGDYIDDDATIEQYHDGQVGFGLAVVATRASDPNFRAIADVATVGYCEVVEQLAVVDTQADWQAGTIPPEADVTSNPGAVQLARKNFVPNAGLTDANADNLPDGWTNGLAAALTPQILASTFGSWKSLKVTTTRDLLSGDGWPGIEGAGAGIDMGNITGQTITFRAKAKIDSLTAGQAAVWCHWWLSDNTTVSVDLSLVNAGDPKIGSGWYDFTRTAVAPTPTGGVTVKGVKYWRPGFRLANAGASLQVEQMQIAKEAAASTFSLYYYPTGTIVTKEIDLGAAVPIRSVLLFPILDNASPAPGAATVTRYRTRALQTDPAGSWVNAVQSAGGGALTAAAPQRYLQLEIQLATTDTAQTPILDRVGVFD